MSSRLHRAVLLALTVALALTLAGTAQGVHWPYFGGDNGRSGHQPVGEGSAPVTPAYSKTAASEEAVQTSILTSTGAPAEQRMIYGTAGGRVHLQRLDRGTPVGPEEGVDIDDGADDADAFTGNGGSVSFAETSTAAGLGQVFAVHNDEDQGGGNDIAIAQLDQEPGQNEGVLVQDQAVNGTNGYTVSSSVVATGADPMTGDRTLFFLATDGTMPRLYRIAIAGAGNRSATIGAVTNVAVPGANPLASPTIVFLNNADGQPTPYVAVGTESTLETFAASNLTDGPESTQLGGQVQTATVPVTPTGLTPGAATSGAERAPLLYVAAATGGTTTVYRLEQEGSADTLTNRAVSQPLPGNPAPALSTDQQSSEGKAGNGKVAVTTASNLYLLDDNGLAPAGKFSPQDLAAGSTGFSRTTAASSGRLLYVTTDGGEQLVLALGNAQRVRSRAKGPGGIPITRPQFTQARANRTSTAAFGQPSISRSFVQFASDRGVFVYRNRCGNSVVGTDGVDDIEGTRGGDDIFGLARRDQITGSYGDDCLTGGSGSDRLDAGDGDDSVDGGTGSDVITGGAGIDVLAGQAGNDELDGGSGRDVLSGGSGNDRLSGGGQDDDLRGGSGNDRMDGGEGRNSYLAGSGRDVINAVNGTRDRINCGSGFDVVRADPSDSVSGCERVSRAR